MAMLPGTDFGRPAEELTVRLAYVDFDGARALEAVGELPLGQSVDDKFAQKHCGDILSAIERVAGWAAGGDV